MPIDYDRYAYVRNSPMNYIDPSGHGACNGNVVIPECDEVDPDGNGNVPAPPPIDLNRKKMIEYIESFGIKLTGNWTSIMLTNLWDALFKVIGYNNLEALLRGKAVTMKSGAITTCETGMEKCYSGLTEDSHITFYQNGASNSVINILHEIGHLVDNLWNNFFTNALEKTTFSLDDKSYGWNDSTYLSLPSSGDYDVRYSALISNRVGGGDAWQQRVISKPHWEDWADIFANGMISNINLSTDLGSQIGNFYSQMLTPILGGTP